MIDKIIKKVDDIINLIAIAFFIIFLLFGLYAFFDAFIVYDSAKLSNDIIKLRPPDNITKEFSLEPLKEINSDICGWLRINDTNIDYPVVIGKDNSEYLNTNYKKEYSTSGSIFLDYRNQRNFEDDYSIIYGHNMRSGYMFSDIKKFEDADFFEQHKIGSLYTETEIYKMDIFCIARVNAFSNDIYNLPIYKNGRTNELINTFSSNASFKRQLEFLQNDKLLLLSTCSSSGSNDRLVLVARLNKYTEGEDNVLIEEGTDIVLEKVENQENKKEETVVSNSDNNNDEKPKKKFELNISIRSLILIILLIVVIIIFIIAITQRVLLEYRKRANNEENKTKK